MFMNKSSKSNLVYLFAGVTLAVLAGTHAFADDSEVFYGNVSNASSNPNILLVIDSSGSMGSTVTSRADYVPATTYTGSCSSGYVYYAQVPTTGTTTVPNCSTSNKIPVSKFFCNPATAAFSNAGLYQDNAIQWVKSVKSGTTKYKWQTAFYPASGGGTTYTSTDVTCMQNTNGNYPVFTTSSSTSSEWAGTSTTNYWTQGGATQSYQFYSANYLNYWNDPSQVTIQTRLQVVQKAAQSLVSQVSGVNIGLASYNANGNGGMIYYPITPVSSDPSSSAYPNVALINTTIGGLHYGGSTPLSETLYEAFLYMSGQPVKYGLTSQKCNNNDFGLCAWTDLVSFPSVATSRTGNTYKSPMTSGCQKDYIVYLTDGLPNSDTDANTLIENLDTSSNLCYPDTATMWTALGVSPPYPGFADFTDGTGLCLKALTSYMYTHDLSSNQAGSQNVITYFVGFGSNVANGDAFKYLQDAAAAGGGQAYLANDLTTLETTLSTIVGSIFQTSATFTTPAISVNSFNQIQVLNNLYIGMFKPTNTLHWPGNVKKFKLLTTGAKPMIVGQDKTTSAVDPITGNFTTAAQDYWQLSTDTNTDITTKGGAANVLPQPDPSVANPRNLYTYVGSNPSSPQPLSSFPVTVADTAVTNALLNIGGSTDPARDVLINWARGDDDGNLSTTSDIRHEMGDPVHSQPAVVIYANSGSTQSQQLNDAVVYAATNDGYLHAFDVVTGIELWSFIPQELLGNLKNLYVDPVTSTKNYELDGNIQIYRFDSNGDDKITPATNDRVYLYVGQGRGGDHYYALDVTDKNNPLYMWSLSTGTASPQTGLSGVVKWSWSTPKLGRVKVGSGSGQNSQRRVLIFAGGYDTQEDNTAYTYISAGDSYGNGMFIVDAVYGTVLWQQTYSTSPSAFNKMTHAIPSDVTLLDSDGDGWTDRMYVGDMAGQIWRFDITNGNSASSLVAGGVIASLGGKMSSNIADNRKFYSAPSVALITVSGAQSYYNIGIGSGDRARPRSNTVTQDYFYAIRDTNFAPMTQTIYDNLTPIQNSDLTTVTGVTAVTIPSTSKGWKLPLSSSEKALAPASTTNSALQFNTYIPGVVPSSSCGIASGTQRTYTMNITTGLAYFSNLYVASATTSIPSGIIDINTSQVIDVDSSSSSSSSSSTPPNTCGSTCLSNGQILPSCINVCSKYKTFWQEAGAN